MLTFDNARKIIDDELKDILNNRQPKELYEPIRYILSLGGKRIRPALTLLSCNLFSDDVAPAIAPAIALEVFHNFTLIHDDIMDNANMRRGFETVHVKWNHNSAILSGDAMNIVAYDYILKCKPNYLIPVFKVFNKAALQVCEGQQLDMDFETYKTVTEAQYLEMIGFKTSVLLAACLKIGAITGGANETDADSLYNFGLNMGLAFQLQDDLLDVYGNEKEFGKEIGKDIVANKKTYLLIKALELSNSKQKDELEKWISLKKFDAKAKVTAISNIYNILQIKELTVKKIDYYFAEARKNLDLANVETSKKLELQLFIDTLIQRKN
jgi:geranylgeranyl diphosphate synthase type II